MKMKIIAGLGALAFASATLAHHSYAMFDRAKQIELTGQITKLDWANPHVWLRVTTAKKVEWQIEARSPGELSRQGLRSIDIKVGDPIKLTVFPARNGKPIASLSSGVLANGKKFGEYRADATQ